MSHAIDRALVWFRRDLRDHDHAALYHALKSARRVYAVFVFDTEILDRLEDRQDRRIAFIHASVAELKAALERAGGGLIVLHGKAREAIPALAKRLAVQTVFANRDYEPSATDRDAEVSRRLRTSDIAFHLFKDQVIFERDEILSKSGKPYEVFTPYRHAWLKQVNDFYLRPYPVERHLHRIAHPGFDTPMPTLFELGFGLSDNRALNLLGGMSGALQLLQDFENRIDRYRETRDFPATKGPSCLSAHLRFGTVSIRRLARLAWLRGGAGAETWLSELIWRDFYFQILHHHPGIAEGHAFKQEFEHLPFSGGELLLDAWRNGRTGYPLIDAAMRQLNQTGHMHNRLRMVTASFLVKDLLVDWRKGEAYFARKLIDYDFAANNGGWQWAASTGCDAQPWFRIFNPVNQSEKFDPQGKFIRRYVPELAACDAMEIHAPWRIPPHRQQALGIHLGTDYPLPVVDHASQRERALAIYRSMRATFDQDS